ncbi:MAG: hypothetical protein PWP67_2617 [Clostridium butyricum]|nr:hypothetical protein [Clostridium butyricum]
MNDYKIIKEYRKKAGLTQKQLGDKVNVSSAYIQQLENGVKNNPSLEIIIKISDVLNIPIETLEKNRVDSIINSFRDTVGINVSSISEIADIIIDAYPTVKPLIQFLSDPKIERAYGYKYKDLINYQELFFKSIEKAIKNTLQDIEEHENNGDIFDGVSSWITKESPVYEAMKKAQENKDK